MKTRIISAFPGTGKTYYFESHGRKMSLDSDSSKFDKAYFPGNYIQHIKDYIGFLDIIFVSSHKEVRDALYEAGLHYILVYPHSSLAEEYRQRYIDRYSSQNFVDMIKQNWDDWHNELINQKGCIHVILPEFTYISDFLE